MGRAGGAILAVLLLSGCVTAGAPDAPAPDGVPDILEKYGSYGGNVFLGVSGRYTSDEKALEAAIGNCARNIALSDEIVMRADIDSRMVSGSSYDTFRVESLGTYGPADIEGIISSMEIVEIGRGDPDTGVYVIASVKGRDAFPPYRETSRDGSGRPDWTRKTPEIPGWRLAAGAAAEHYHLQDSLEAASYEGALSLLLGDEGALTVGSSVTHTGDCGIRKDVYQISMDALHGFTVLEYWNDSSERMYWALVAARK